MTGHLPYRLLLLSAFACFCLAIVIGLWMPHTAHAALTEGLMARWSFDTRNMYPNVRDISGQRKHVSLSGFTSTTTVAGRIREALTFNGSSEYISLGTSFSGQSTFTWAAWIKTTQNSGNSGAYYQMPVVMGTVQGSGDTNDALLGVNFGVLSWYDEIGGGAVSTGRSVNDGVWHHIAATKSGTALSIYLDGQVVATRTIESGAYNSNNMEIAKANWNENRYFGGSIDDVRIYNRALSVSEIADLYRYRGVTSANTTPTTPLQKSGLVGHWTFDGKDMTPNVRDASGQGNHATLSGFTSTTTVAGSVGQGLRFDGVNDYAVTSNSTVHQKFTYAVWVRSQSNGSMDVQEILSKRSYCANATNDFPTALYLNPAGTQATVFVDSGNDYSMDLSAQSGAFTTGVWHHIAATYNSSRLAIFVDGVLSNSADGSVALSNNSQNWTIGKQSQDGGGCGAGKAWFKGDLDDLRIYNRAMSDVEVKQLYQAGLPAKTNATVVNPVQKNGLVGHWSFDGNAMYPNVRDKSGQGNHGTLSGFTSTTSIAGRIGQALLLNGSTQYVGMGDQSSLNPGSGNFTISTWFKTNSTQQVGIVSKRNNSAPFDQYQIGIGRVDSCGGGSTNQGSVYFFAKETGGSGWATAYSTNSTGYANGKWHHAVVVYTAGGTAAIYVDGVAAAVTRDCNQGSLTSIAPSANFAIGYNNGSGYFNGAVDDTRIYNRALTAQEVSVLYNSARSTMR